jgi:hypothetical protein
VRSPRSKALHALALFALLVTCTAPTRAARDAAAAGASAVAPVVSSRAKPIVPDALTAGGTPPFVLPAKPPEGYWFYGVDLDLVREPGVGVREVVVAPEDVSNEPTVRLCVDTTPERKGCATLFDAHLRRTFRGVPVLITLQGERSAAALDYWRSVALTDDPTSTGLFAD